MAFMNAILLSVATIQVIIPVADTAIDYRGKAIHTWPAATAHVPLVAQPGPKVTPTSYVHRARLQNRQLPNSLCGFYQYYGAWETVHCSYGISCVADRAQSPAYFYCSDVGSFDLPVTAVYDYGDWPLGGCVNGGGQLCCGSDMPYWGEYQFDDFATVLYGCTSLAHFTISATTSEPFSTTFTTPTTLSSLPSPTTTPSPAFITTTTTPPFATTTSISFTTPFSSTTTTTSSSSSPSPIQTPSPAGGNSPTSMGTSSSILSTSDKIALGVGIPCAVVAVIYLFRGFVFHKWGV